jgi:hypothetical protein
MDYGEDARARELSKLRLALATFALQLDGFELRAHVVLLAADKDVGKKSLKLGKNDWPSIKLHGNKSGT